MFGRRNPEPAATPVQPQTDDSVELDLLPDLPEFPRSSETHASETHTATAIATAPPDDHSPFERAWQNEPVSYQPNVPQPTPFVPPPALAPAPFSSAVAAPTAAPTPAVAPLTARLVSESVIGPDDFFDGNYRSERGVRLQGTVRGSIESRQYIFVEAGAKVEANLSAEEITVAGEFNGMIECRQRLEITETGVVHGQVTTTMLVVQEGGQLDGELHMRRQGAGN